jgi:hypothetical protein
MMSKKLELIFNLYKSQKKNLENYFDLKIELLSKRLKNYVVIKKLKKNILLDLSIGLNSRDIKKKYNLYNRKDLLVLVKHLF